MIRTLALALSLLAVPAHAQEAAAPAQPDLAFERFLEATKPFVERFLRGHAAPHPQQAAPKPAPQDVQRLREAVQAIGGALVPNAGKPATDMLRLRIRLEPKNWT